MNDKANDAFKTISEVSALLDVPQHVLRFWESKFSSLRPLKRSGGRRYYRPDDVAVLRRIRQLLYVDGFTIKGAQKHLSAKPGTVSGMDSATASSAGLAEAMSCLDNARKSMAALRNDLDHQG